MLTLRAFRYRAVMADAGGPVGHLETREFQAFGRRYHQASAWLVEGLARDDRRLVLYSDADGTAAHPDAASARHLAISEALERWAYGATAHSNDAGRYGFDLDASSNGIAADPSIFARKARRAAMLEAVGRFCVMRWWERRLPGECRSTEWPGISAVAIDGPFGGVAVVLHRRSDWGYHSYGHAAAESFSGACEKALVDLVRNDGVLRSRWLLHGGLANGPAVTDRLERRCLFFSGEQGHEIFLERVRGLATEPCPPCEVVADAEIRGPWSRYARVWRFVLRPASPAFIEEDERYFFW